MIDEHINKLFIRFLKESEVMDLIYQYLNKEEINILKRQIKQLSNIENSLLWIITKLRTKTNNQHYSNISQINKHLVQDWETFYLKQIHNKTKKDVFIDFLNEYTKTLYTFNTDMLYERLMLYTKKERNENFDDLIIKYKLKQIVDLAFTWGNTYEGNIFYINLANAFIEYLKNKFNGLL